jgi:hypothetical protein
VVAVGGLAVGGGREAGVVGKRKKEIMRWWEEEDDWDVGRACVDLFTDA